MLTKQFQSVQYLEPVQSTHSNIYYICVCYHQNLTLHKDRVNKEDLITKLKQTYSGNPLQFWKPEHPRAKIELTQEIHIKEKPTLYSPEDIKEFSIQIKELLDKSLIRPSKGSFYG